MKRLVVFLRILCCLGDIVSAWCIWYLLRHFLNVLTLAVCIAVIVDVVQRRFWLHWSDWVSKL